MAADQWKNNAAGTLLTAIGTGDTSLTLQAGEGAEFATPGVGYYATLEHSSVGIEIVRVTALATDTFTITRAQQGTTAKAFPVGARFEQRVTAASLNKYEAAALGMTDTVWLDAKNLQGVFGAPAFITTIGTGQVWPAWQLDASALEAVAQVVVLPLEWSSYDVHLYWTNSSSVNTGDVVWRLDYLTAGDGENVSLGVTNGPPVTATAPGQYAMKVTTLATGVAAYSGHPTWVRIIRLASFAADTLPGDAALIGVLLKKKSLFAVVHPDGPSTFSATPGLLVTLASAAGTYDAFPGVVRCQNDDVLVAWRRSTAHAIKGNVFSRRSTDGGLTFAAETQMLTGAFGTATFSLMEDGRVCYAGWIWTGTTEAPYVAFSSDHGATFGAQSTINHGFTGRAVIEGPVIELSSGDLLVAVWGRNTEDATDRNSVKVLRSTDGGSTFDTPVLVAHGPTHNFYWNEAGLVVLPSGTILCVIREETQPFTAVSRSYDNGQTWTMPERLHSMPQYTGAPKPSPFIADMGPEGIAAFILREEEFPGEHAHLVVTEGGLHWRAVELDSTGRMVYGQACRLDADTLGVAYAVEQSASQSNVYFVPVDVAIT